MFKIRKDPLILTLLFAMCTARLSAAPIEVTFAYIGHTGGSAFAGVQQGLSEANLQGQFLGQKYDVKTFSNAGELAGNTGKFIAIVAALPAGELTEFRHSSENIPIINLIASENDLRSQCSDNILHVGPSDKMLQDAVEQWQKKNPGTEVSAQAWHPDFVKFAARDLNKRFRKNHGTAMDDHAWAGWASIKMVSDMVARHAITDAVEMLRMLKTNLSFDGQKGVDMNFRETGQLRQLVLITENGKLLGEAPVRGVSGDIDSLGIRGCSK